MQLVHHPTQPVTHPIQPVPYPTQPAFQPTQPAHEPLQPAHQFLPPALQSNQPVLQPNQPGLQRQPAYQVSKYEVKSSFPLNPSIFSVALTYSKNVARYIYHQLNTSQAFITTQFTLRHLSIPS
jgi:hypothetical protein